MNYPLKKQPKGVEMQQWRQKEEMYPNAPKAQQRRMSGRRRRTFNMSTYKIHALGDYPRAIWMFGTTDGFTTQVVSNCS